MGSRFRGLPAVRVGDPPLPEKHEQLFCRTAEPSAETCDNFTVFYVLGCLVLFMFRSGCKEQLRFPSHPVCNPTSGLLHEFRIYSRWLMWTRPRSRYYAVGCVSSGWRRLGSRVCSQERIVSRAWQIFVGFIGSNNERGM